MTGFVFDQDGTTGKWEIGFFGPEGTWYVQDEFDTRSEAEHRLRYYEGAEREPFLLSFGGKLKAWRESLGLTPGKALAIIKQGYGPPDVREPAPVALSSSDITALEAGTAPSDAKRDYLQKWIAETVG